MVESGSAAPVLRSVESVLVRPVSRYAAGSALAAPASRCVEELESPSLADLLELPPGAMWGWVSVQGTIGNQSYNHFALPDRREPGV